MFLLLVSYRPLAPLGFCACLLLYHSNRSLNQRLQRRSTAFSSRCTTAYKKFDASESASCRFGLAH
jgi:hypothetical protein